MSIIDKNQPNFFGNNGTPLTSAYIYIGLPNQTPVEYPKTVTFTDSSGNAFTAAQPLRTNSDGQIVWNGKAIIATTDGDYSMLILDSTQTQINGGYIPFVSGELASVITLTDYREYGLTLADVKQVNVSPGQTIGSVGGIAATDRLGADWLVVSNTGGTADNIDLIDFDNGLQGVRLRNNLQPQDNLDSLSNNATARSNLGIIYTKQIFTASGTWTKPAGCRFIEVECVGGGGGGGGGVGDANPSINTCTGGGGGGAFARSLIDVTAITSETVTIGAGGAGSTGNVTGITGGDTSFGALVIAKGGAGSAGNTAFSSSVKAGAYGGFASASTGDFKLNGGAGTKGFCVSTLATSGEGGSSFYAGTTRKDSNAGSYGGGGSGAATIVAGNTQGFAGTAGVVYIREFY